MIHAFEKVDLVRLDQLAQTLAASSIGTLSIGLVGTLGAGKTTFVKRLAAAMGVDESDVTSPTFTLQQSYDSTTSHRRLNHLDAYRINDLDAWDDLGIDELHETQGHWTLIEWADRVSVSMPLETLWIRFQMDSVDLRIVEVQGGPDGVVPQWVERMDTLDAAAAK